MIALLDDVRVGYDDVGAGGPIVFLHGFPHDRSLWSEQVSALSTHVRCIVPDLRGFGESSTDGPFSMDRYADDLAALLTHLNIDTAVVCGLSMGGYVAMAMWRRHAHRVRALVFCDTKVGADTPDGINKRNDLMSLAERDGSVAVAAWQIEGMVGKTTRARRPDIVQRAQRMMERAPVVGIVGALAAMRDRPDSASTLASVTVPTLVIVGDEDALTPLREASAIAAALPIAVAPVLEIIEGSGHLTCVERPAAVTHALAHFLATLHPQH
jgi:3-oxoadipate enol-lactonase